MPFTLSVEVSGFAETPQPKLAPFAIPGCRLTFLGVSPSVSTMVSIVNGQKSEARNVTFVYRYRIEAERAGSYAIPPLTVEQLGRRAQSRRVSFSAGDIASSKDMLIRLTLPERPVMVGETFDVTLDWYLHREVRGQTFVVPLFEQQDWVEVDVPRSRSSGGQRLVFAAGSRNLELPFQRDQQTVGGVAYTRFRFVARVTPTRVGTLELAPARVLAQLDVGMGRDMFGFPAPKTSLFKAEDVPRRLVIRETPREGRPRSFANAVGTGFSIEVQAERTVVRVGDPIELRVLVRGDHLEGLTLPPLGADVGLSPELFSLPDETPPGELLPADEKDASGRPGGKLFRVVVRLRRADVREIPPIAFSYFNSEKGKYETVRSQPIAISVKGAAVVGAGDVVTYGGEAAEPPAPAIGKPGEPRRPLAAIGADLSLSQEGQTLRQVPTLARLAPWLFALYGLAIGIFSWRLWNRRTRGRRAAADGLRRQRSTLSRELEEAAAKPAREATPGLLTALRALARTLGPDAGEAAGLIERLETASFDPRAQDCPLPADLLDEARRLAASWTQAVEPGARAGQGSKTRFIVLVLGAVAASSAIAGADPAAASATGLATARQVYRDALNQTDTAARAAGFAAAESLYADLTDTYPDRPELLTDWGNAALGAHDFGKAALAYRRALRLDATAERASKNLAWLRSAMPEWLPRPPSSAMDSLFFWHYALAVPWRHLIGALAFLAALLLLAPWGDRRLSRWRRAAVVPAVVWLAMVGSLVVEHDAARDAVVQQEGVTLRSADSLGAPPVLPQPLPAGAELTILEQRQGWARVSLGNRSAGWVEARAIATVR